ncbi:carboxymuconolactone decarboxylase family protein [Phytoactinopolyspora mesophila]|uniref:Carboxymuconolactone decarboxylase family protein n=1 Tax=Phytoactinopolyspora mesophila TaxID=2650750 RepID=A0A7K3MCB3_9ACTN|nr:carboxymuconolactone decarboxylase family protein [Phytoactinopolyspora mesophila]NDL60959.1 carboxymuconolactone decarboxylase family protein [Phytoactinopolyspora mesophila]
MSRLPLIQPEDATGPAAELLAGVRNVLGVTPNMVKAMANSATVLDAYLEFNAALADGVLPVGIRERIAILVAQENECDYCLSAHSFAASRQAKLDNDELRRVRNGTSSDPRSEAIVGFAAAVVRCRGDITEEQLRQARASGLTEQEIAEVVGHVALNVFSNYFNKAADVEIDAAWPSVRHDL